MTTDGHDGIGVAYDDVWLVGGRRTAFADYGGTLKDVSATDLGIVAGRAALAENEVPSDAIDAVVAASLAPSDFDALYLPRHVGLYCGVPRGAPALGVQRLCGSGFEAVAQAADAIQLGKLDTALCVGAESMSRNPIAAFDLRGGFRLGHDGFKDFLAEALWDPASETYMGQTAENLATEYQITRDAVDDYAARSFAAAHSAQQNDFLSGEIAAVAPGAVEAEGYAPRRIKLPRGVALFEADEHVRDTPREVLAKLKPVFGGVQTAGNSSAIVDGAAAAVVARGNGRDAAPLARIVASAAAGVPPHVMGIGPAPAIRKVLEIAGLGLDDIDRFEINEAFGAQYLAVERELGLDRARVNVNGGAIAIGHPLAATGLRILLTLARELRRSGGRTGVGAACIGGGQGIAVVLDVGP